MDWVEILDERSLGFSDQDREDVRLVAGRGHCRMITSGKGKGISVTGHVSLSVSVKTVAELGTKASRWVEAPVVHFLVRRLPWLVRIVFVGWIARPAAFVSVQFTD